MHQFVKLPSGLVVNLSLVSQVVPVNDTLEIHFTGSDIAVLKGEDIEAFRSRSGLHGALSSTSKTVLFWAVIIAAVLFVYFFIRSTR